MQPRIVKADVGLYAAVAVTPFGERIVVNVGFRSDAERTVRLYSKGGWKCAVRKIDAVEISPEPPAPLLGPEFERSVNQRPSRVKPPPQHTGTDSLFRITNIN